MGTSDAEQTRAVSDLLSLIKDIPMSGRQDYDVLGFIYEYLISQLKKGEKTEKRIIKYSKKMEKKYIFL